VHQPPRCCWRIASVQNLLGDRDDDDALSGDRA
jgi:hypothetical protein